MTGSSIVDIGDKDTLDKYRQYLGEDWVWFFRPFLLSPKMREIENKIKEDKNKGYRIYPKTSNVFNAFHYTRLENTRVVIIGMDPYHKPHQAIGLSFAVNDNYTKVPPSLKIIDKEIQNEYGDLNRDTHMLTSWTSQGVLMLNASLTVREGDPGSHSKIWREFTSYTIRELSSYQPTVFLLMGRKAQHYEKYIDKSMSTSVHTPHPAAETYTGNKAGFLGSDCFKQVNQKLITDLDRHPVDWTAEDVDGIDIKP